MSSESSFDKGIADAGGLAATAAALGETIQTVTNWRSRGVPANRCKAFAAITGVSIKALRPKDWADYWPELADEAA